MSDRNVTKKSGGTVFRKIARQIEELKMTTFFKKFASETHICSASSDSTLCKRQNRHLRLPQTHVDVNHRILTKKINFPASRSGDFNGATPSVYLFNILVIITRLNYSISTYIATDKTQPPSPCSKMGNDSYTHGLFRTWRTRRVAAKSVAICTSSYFARDLLFWARDGQRFRLSEKFFVELSVMPFGALRMIKPSKS